MWTLDQPCRKRGTGCLDEPLVLAADDGGRLGWPLLQAFRDPDRVHRQGRAVPNTLPRQDVRCGFDAGGVHFRPAVLLPIRTAARRTRFARPMRCPTDSSEGHDRLAAQDTRPQRRDISASNNRRYRPWEREISVPGAASSIGAPTGGRARVPGRRRRPRASDRARSRGPPSRTFRHGGPRAGGSLTEGRQGDGAGLTPRLGGAAPTTLASALTTQRAVAYGCG